MGASEYTPAGIAVPVGAETKLPFRLTVPAGTPPGDYAGAIIIQSPPMIGKSAMAHGDATVRLDTSQCQGVRIYLTVAGTAVKRMGQGQVTWAHTGSSTTFTLPVHNSGNITLHPTAELTVHGWFGLDTKAQFRTPEAALPGGTYEFKTQLQHAPLVAVGTASAAIVSKAGTQPALVSLLYIPWWLTVGILIALAALAFGIWRVARFIRKARRALAQVASLYADPTRPLTDSSTETSNRVALAHAGCALTGGRRLVRGVTGTVQSIEPTSRLSRSAPV